MNTNTIATQSGALDAKPERVLPVLKEGTIIVPYRKGHSMLLYANLDAGSPDCFIRTRLHQERGVWYSDVDELADRPDICTPRDPHHYRGQGIVVFLTANQLTADMGVRITRMFNSGKSARGTVVKLPDDWQDLYAHDVQVRFKPI